MERCVTPCLVKLNFLTIIAPKRILASYILSQIKIFAKLFADIVDNYIIIFVSRYNVDDGGSI